MRDRLRSRPADWSSGLSSASSGSVGFGYDSRPGELTVACRIRHSSYAFVWHCLGVPTCSVRVRAWKVGEVLKMGLGRLVSPRVQVFRCVLRRTRSVGNWVKCGLN
ncbi:hypothetical protein PIB30_057457 [Stylosanthes scabra]|uniref:Uncharacterized protein n=1 Tax=Stylosanthes scabra TaxID=79078 RepID=A0ABU6YIZ2_9FABA|nr:hypothetical protein [Stylosanthes scabra]